MIQSCADSVRSRQAPVFVLANRRFCTSQLLLLVLLSHGAMNKIKLSAVLTLLVLLLIFSLQNMAVVEVKFLVFRLSISRALLLLMVYAVGLVSGLVLFRTLGRAKN
ncbi:MAG: putative membrane protein [Lentimonas sp.]|jgi:putative membrane protein